MFPPESLFMPDFREFVPSPDDASWDVTIGDHVPRRDGNRWLKVIQQAQRQFPPWLYDRHRYSMEQGYGLMVCLPMVIEMRSYIQIPHYRTNRTVAAELTFTDGSTYPQSIFGLFNKSGQMGLIDGAYYMHGPRYGGNTSDTTYGQFLAVVAVSREEASHLLSVGYSQRFGKQVGVRLGISEPV
jgi:hypothetical protein